MKRAVLLVFLCIASATVTGQTLPVLHALNGGDPLFAQHLDSITAGTDSPLSVMVYYPIEGDTFYSVAARLQLNHATLASVNRLDSPRIEGGIPLLIPNRNGLFVPRNAETPLEQLYTKRNDTQTELVLIPFPSDGRTESFHFIPDIRFSSLERLVFTRSLLVNPLPGSIITSSFGSRIDPLTQLRSFHEGVDLATPFGTPVRSAASGTVERVSRDRILGLSVYIVHNEYFRTRYAHLRTTFVESGDSVTGGMVIGEVGSTGYSTGPHLHFEVLIDDIPVDPLHFITVD